MKSALSLALTLLTTMSSAATDVAGIALHSSVPRDQVALLKLDLRYVFASKPSTSNSELLRILEAKVVDGPGLFHFLANRVRYVLGADYSLHGEHLVQKDEHTFPQTPLPDVASETLSRVPEIDAHGHVTLANVGASLYIAGKTNSILLGLVFDGKKIYASSPRVGIVRVEESMFATDRLVNPQPRSAANSIVRLSSLFHEARHSDGTGKSTGFLHDLCPPEHDLADRPACEAISNGPYSLGAQVEKHLLEQCSDCSEVEKTQLAANISDSLSRVIKVTSSARMAQLTSMIRTFKETRDVYQQLLATVQGERHALYRAELNKLMARIIELEAELVAETRRVQSAPPPVGDARAEGSFKEIPITKTTGAMRAFLRGRP